MSADSGGDEIDEDTKRRLVESIADRDEARVVEILDRVGWNVLHGASFPYVCERQDDRGTLLHVACNQLLVRKSRKRRHIICRLVKLFLERGADPDKKSSVRGTRPLHICARASDVESCALLISVGCTVNAVDERGETPLHWARVARRSEGDNVVALLIRNGADPNCPCITGQRPLHHASRLNRIRTAKLLVEYSADINATDRNGLTPLHHACRLSSTSIVDLLVGLGADITITDKNHHTALYTALATGNLASARALISAASLLDPALVAGSLQLQKFDFRQEMILQLPNGLELLSFAFAYGALKTADEQLTHEALSLAGVGDASISTALLKAIEEESVAKTIILVSAGAALGGASDEVFTKCLHLAEKEGSIELALAVLQSDAFHKLDSNVVSIRDVLEMAVKEDSVALVRAMCRVEEFAHAAMTALNTAIRNCSVKFVTNLCKAGVFVGAEMHTILNVLDLALDNASVELALIACKALGESSKVNCPHLKIRMQRTLRVALDIASVELAIAACQEGALALARSRVVNDVLQLGLRTKSVSLLQTVGSLASSGTVTFNDVLQFALENTFLELAVITCEACVRLSVGVSFSMLQDTLQLALKAAAVGLATAACQGGALTTASSETVSDILQLGLRTKSVSLLQTVGSLASSGTPTFNDVFQFALENTFLHLAVITCEACVRLSVGVSFSMLQATLQLALKMSSVELAIAACQAGGLGRANSPLATARREALLSLLQLAVKKVSARLAMIALKAGAATSADHKLLADALEVAIETSSIDLLSFLAEAGTLKQASDSVKEKVLRQAAVTGDLQLAEQCISSGVLHGVDQWDNPTAIDIAAQRGHSRLAEKLSKALDNHKLLNLGKKDANTVLIRVVGSPGAGKSTLVKSLRTSRLWGFFRWESQADEGDKNFQTRTRGIQVDSYEDSNGTCYRILDLGGQQDFACGNQLFVGEGQVPIINIITISSQEHVSAIEDGVLKWSAFLASRLDRSNIQQEAHRQPVIVVATRSESATTTQKDNVEKAVDKANRFDAFGNLLNFRHGPEFVDARKSWGHGMEKLRLLLASVAKNILKRAPPQAALCNDIQRALPLIRAQVKRPIISRKELPELVAQGLSSWWRPFDKNVIESHSDLLDAALRQMSDACEILSFESPELKDLLVIHPPWLLHGVVGVLLSPANFPPPRIRYDKNGRASRNQAEKALGAKFGPDMVDGGVALQMAAQLGLSILDEEQDGSPGEGMIVPSKLENSRDLRAVLSAGNHATIWFGIELQCTEIPLAVCLFSQLQVHLYNHLLTKCKQKPIMWSGGIAVALRNEQVVGIVEAQHGRVAIDIIVQGTKATRRTCYCLLQVLKEETLLKAQKFSPGSDITEKILSSRELSTLDWSKSSHVPRITYKREDVQEALKQGDIRPQNDDESLCILEDAFNLMAIPPTHVSLMTASGYKRFCYQLNCFLSSVDGRFKWKMLANHLKILPHEMPDSAVSDPTDALLQSWFRQSAEHTLDHLLTAVKKLGDNEAVSILEEELSLSLKILPGDPEPFPAATNSNGESGATDINAESASPQVQTKKHSAPPASADEHWSLPTAAAPERHPTHSAMSIKGDTQPPMSVKEHNTQPVVPVKERSTQPAVSVKEHSTQPVLPAKESSTEPATPVKERSTQPAMSVEECSTQPAKTVKERSAQPSIMMSVKGDAQPAASMSVTKGSMQPAMAFTKGSLRPTMPITKGSMQPTKSGTKGSTRPAMSATKGSTQPAISSTKGSTQPAMSVTKGSMQPAMSVTKGRMQPATSVTKGSTRPAASVTKGSTRPATSVTKGSTRPAASVTKGSTRPAMSVKEHSPQRNPFSTQSSPSPTKGCTAMISRDGIASAEEFVKVSKTFYNMFECKQLAVYLEISDGGRIVSALNSSNPAMTVSDVAYNILQTWKEERKSAATSAELQRVLRGELKKKDASESVWPKHRSPTVSAAGSDEDCSFHPEISTLTAMAAEACPGAAPLTHGPEDGVSEKVIMDLARNFSDYSSCRELAVFLDITRGSKFVESSNQHATSYEKAYDVMMEWRKENGSAATGERLYRVLHNKLNMKDLAEKFEEALRRKDPC